MNFEFDIADIVHAIREDKDIHDPLVRVLRLPAEDRNDALKKLAFSVGERGGPQALIDALMSLQRTDLAEQVLAGLNSEGGGLSAGAQKFFKRFFRIFRLFQ